MSLPQPLLGIVILTIISHGTQGILNTASKGTLENEFGTSNEDEVIKQILQKGDVQSTQVRHDNTQPISCHLLSNVNLQTHTDVEAELRAPG